MSIESNAKWIKEFKARAQRGGKKITIRGKDYLSSCFWETSSKHLAGTRESTDTWQGCEKTLQIETTAKGHVQEHRLPATHAGVVAPLKQQIKASSCAAQAALTSFDTIGTTQRGFLQLFGFFINAVYLQWQSRELRENVIKIQPHWRQAFLAVFLKCKTSAFTFLDALSTIHLCLDILIFSENFSCFFWIK